MSSAKSSVKKDDDAGLGRKVAQEEMSEEEAGLLSAWAELQHGGEELRRSPGS